MTFMTLNVSNHNGALLADHFLDPQFIPRVFYSKKSVQSGKLAVFRDLDEDRGYERSYGN